MKLNIISVVLFLLIFVWSNVYPFLLNFVLQNVEIYNIRIVYYNIIFFGLGDWHNVIKIVNIPSVLGLLGIIANLLSMMLKNNWLKNENTKGQKFK